MPDGTVFAGSVHALKNHQQGIAIGCIVKLLQRTQTSNMLSEKLFILLLRLAKGPDNRRPFFEVDLLSGSHSEIL